MVCWSPSSFRRCSAVWYVYIVRCDDNKLYTGITTDMVRRWRQHSGVIKGGAKFFRGRRPQALIHLEQVEGKSTALKREFAIKRLSRAQKLALQDPAATLLIEMITVING